MSKKPHEITIAIGPFLELKAKCCNCSKDLFIQTTLTGDHLFATCAWCNSINDIYLITVERPDPKSGKESRYEN